MKTIRFVPARRAAAIGLTVLASAILAACGGGGGGAGSTGSAVLTVSAQTSLDGVAGQSVVLNGYAQTAGQAIASGAWQQISGPTVQIANAGCSSATQNTIAGSGGSAAAASMVNYTCPLTVSLPVSGSVQQYGFRFTATDVDGHQQTANATVNATATPAQSLSVVAGPNANLYPGQTYKGSCQTAGGLYPQGQSPTYQWSITGPSGVTPPALTASGASVAFTAPEPASQENFQVTCQATDGVGSSATGTANVSVYGTAALPPLLANAGAAQLAQTATPVTLQAAAQTASGAPTAPVYYYWKQTSGTAVSLSNINTASASFVTPGNPAPTATASAASSPAPSVLATLTFTVYVSYQPIDPSNLSAIPSSQQAQTTVEVIQQ